MYDEVKLMNYVSEYVLSDVGLFQEVIFSGIIFLILKILLTPLTEKYVILSV